MKRLRFEGLATCTLVLLLSAGALGQRIPGFAEDDRAFGRYFVAGGSVGYLMMPPALVSGPEVRQATWSPSGNYIAIQRATCRITARQVASMLNGQTGSVDASLQGDIGDIELLVYSRQGKLIPIWKAGLAQGSLIQVQWLVSDVLVALTQQRDAQGKPALVYMIARPSGSSFATTSLPAGAGWRSHESSPTNAAVAIDTDDGLYVVRGDGRDSVIKAELRPPKSRIVWSADCREPYVEALDAEGAKQYFAISATELVPLKEAPGLFNGKFPDEPKLPVKLKTQDCTLNRGSATVKVKSAWLEIPDPNGASVPGLLCADCLQASLAPAADAVLYVTADGAAFVRGLLPVDPALAVRQREAAARIEVMNCGKQIGMALFKYMADNEDRLPNPADLASELKPYLRGASADVLSLFQYTFTGDSLGSVEHPSATTLGYLPAPGGLVFLYADGHVTFSGTQQP